MIHALHGHAGLPDDLMPLLRFAGQPFQEWHLWRTLTNHPESASLDGFATLLNDTASHDGHHLRILLGYSLGGRLALHALTQQPQMWDAAIILSAHPGLSTDEERAGRLTHDQAWAAHFLHDSWPEVMAAWNEQAVFRSSTFQCRVECADLAFDFGAGAKRRQTAAGSPKGERSESKSSCLESWREQIALGFDVWSLG